MQKRRLAGGLVAVGVLAGAWFSGMFGKLGGGTGTGPGDGTSATPVVASTRPAEPASGTLTDKKTADPKKADTKQTDPKQATAKKSADPADKAKTEAASEKKAAQTSRQTLPEEIATLDIYVQGHNYQIKHPVTGDHLRAEMADVIRLAKRTKGNEDGLRVRIHRYKDARVVGWSRLCAELEAAGLQREKDFVMPHEALENVRAQANTTKTPAEKSN